MIGQLRKNEDIGGGSRGICIVEADNHTPRAFHPDMKETYKQAGEFVSKYFNLNKLGCLFNDKDYEKATKKTRDNEGAKMRARLKKPTRKTIVRLNHVLQPFVFLKSDQELEGVE